MSAATQPIHRFTASTPCPVCHGHDRMQRGQGVRCFGFLGSDGRYAHCSREEFANSIEMEPKSNTYAHLLEGRCRCGETHGTEKIVLRLPRKQQRRREPKSANDWKPTQIYPYHDQDGKVLYEVCAWRTKGEKHFAQRRPDGAGGWVGELGDVSPVLYRLPELVAAIDAGDTVYVVEGEKDADAIRDAGGVATCNPMGAGKWRDQYTESLRGANVVVIPDWDGESTTPPYQGEKHAATVFQSVKQVAASITLRRAAHGKDPADHLDAGGTLETLIPVNPDEHPGVEPPRTKASPHPEEEHPEPPVEQLVTCLADVKQERWEWLLPGRIPFGAITGITGPPGMGKGVLVHDLLARWSTGGELPDGSRCDPITSILLTREDDPSKTLQPRLQIAGADLHRILIWNRAPSPDGLLRPPNIMDHLGTLSRLVDAYSARIVVVDPLLTFLGVERSAFEPQPMADAMTGLQERVAELNVALMIVNHPAKGTRNSAAVERFMGAMSSIGVLRALFEVRPDPQDPDRRLMAQSKNNLAIAAGALVYQIREEMLPAEDGGEPISVPRVEWLGVQEGVTSQTLDASDRAPRTGKAMAWLASRLASASSSATGVPAYQLIDEAQGDGISKNALYSAKDELGVESTPKGFGGSVKWYIPSIETPPE